VDRKAIGRLPRRVVPAAYVFTPCGDRGGSVSYVRCRKRVSGEAVTGNCSLVYAPVTGDDLAAHEGTYMSVEPNRIPRLPPPWFIRAAWAIHRAIYRLTGGRLGLWRPKPGKWGTMRLKTIGRRTGRQRVAILGYYEDGPNLVTMAMNGWLDGEPGWWLNLQEHPDTTVDLAGGSHLVHARAAQGDERSRLWARWREMGDGLDAYATRRSSETAVVILEPLAGS
jgi:F420H(2)-dependent quinone reductase